MRAHHFAYMLCLCLLAGCAGNCVSMKSPLFILWAGDLDGHAARISSWDKSGGNDDSIRILPDETVTLADIRGAGIIRHIWMTTNAADPVGRMLILRMLWDGSETPAVEVPFGDFFGVGNGMVADVNSFPITVVSNGTARNCWWSMPFSKGARITLTNEGPQTVSAFYYHIDYLALDAPPHTCERFYAQYRQAYPATGSENYKILEAKGRGHYVGLVMSVDSTKPRWWGEGDDLIIADDYEPLHGTGTEDFFCDAWGMHKHATLWHGSPITEGFDKAGLRTSMYRFNILDPIPFRKSLSISIEHGTQNDRSDNLSSVAFWYQTPPALPFPHMPSVEMRLSGAEQIAFIRECALKTAFGEIPTAQKILSHLESLTTSDENKAMMKGLMIYAAEKQNPSDIALEKIDAYLNELAAHLNAIPENERTTTPTISAPTDNDARVPGPVLACHDILERVRNDFARRLALRRGLRPGDEIIVEARDPLGKLNIITYEDNPDFSNSYAKADDTHLTGNGARFTYGNVETSSARFTPDFPCTGRYEVFTIFSYGANADDVRYEVNHADGKTVISLNQRGRPGTLGRNNLKWHRLGEFRFEKGRNPEKGSITLVIGPRHPVPNPRFEYRAYADSVRFIFKSE